MVTQSSKQSQNQITQLPYKVMLGIPIPYKEVCT